MATTYSNPNIRQQPSELLVTGNRPVSASGSRRNPYHKVGGSSSVDETLFGRPLQEATFEPPWVDNPRNNAIKPRPQKPLLWTPPSNNNSTCRVNSGFRPNTPTRLYNKYRLKKHTPSYVDESLFGPKLQEANFDPPWVKKEEQQKTKPYLWSPPVCGSRCTMSSRPNSARSVSKAYTGTGSRPSSRAGSVRTSTPKNLPPWR
ncbi:RBPJ-interacting and tubulin-associated protein 1-like [Saccoglossus kowalevskii]|uniref:RBPJ-interacting and tubulin-associated protein 1 n=1 Tax=Saccoglossus kowalevskii TaxID=10224 RepID=A0ABM0GSA0_SACKO|nr:PREDICTED: RBPJ-interacting and tubulin-associated protein-like [Saccoglossus kowalevskii]